MAFTPFTKEDKPTMENFNEKFLSAILEGKTQALDECVKIATGSYTGTGTYGASNPNSLTFDFAPKMVIIPMIKVTGSYISFSPTISQNNNCAWIMMDDLTTEYTQYIGFDGNAGSGSYRYAKKSADGKTIYWYNTQNQYCQINDTTYTAYYVAIG